MKRKIAQYTDAHPVSAAILLMLTALLFRLIDIFALKLDETLGEIILSKAIGFILVLLFLRLTGRPVAYIGFTKKYFAAVILTGGVLTLFLLSLGYLTEITPYRGLYHTLSSKH